MRPRLGETGDVTGHLATPTSASHSPATHPPSPLTAITAGRRASQPHVAMATSPTDDGPTFNEHEIQQLFLRLFVSIFQKYRKYLVFPTEEEWASGGSTVLFRKEEWLAQLDKEDRQFAAELIETQAFMQFNLERVVRAADDCEVLFFDDCIRAKMNRSRFRINKELTPFLDVRNGREMGNVCPIVHNYAILGMLVTFWCNFCLFGANYAFLGHFRAFLCILVQIGAFLCILFQFPSFLPHFYSFFSLFFHPFFQDVAKFRVSKTHSCPPPSSPTPPPSSPSSYPTFPTSLFPHLLTSPPPRARPTLVRDSDELTTRSHAAAMVRLIRMQKQRKKQDLFSWLTDRGAPLAASLNPGTVPGGNALLRSDAERQRLFDGRVEQVYQNIKTWAIREDELDKKSIPLIKEVRDVLFKQQELLISAVDDQLVDQYVIWFFCGFFCFFFFFVPFLCLFVLFCPFFLFRTDFSA